MIVFLSRFLHDMVSRFKARAQLEAEIILLRHQLRVLRRSEASAPPTPPQSVPSTLLWLRLQRGASVR
jgi:hypothetical protein